MAEGQVSKWNSVRGTLTRGRPSFLTRSATDDAGELLRRSSLPPIEQGNDISSISKPPNGHYQDHTPLAVAQDVSLVQPTESDPLLRRRRGSQGGARHNDIEAGRQNAFKQSSEFKSTTSKSTKLDTFSGVFVPTSLNVLSILMFIRFGFILGQTGLLGMLALLLTAYAINLVTTFSISAVASNGTVRGGGAYYLISRSLGPEFGGSIGIVSYIGFVLNTGMNAVGLVDCLIYNFGQQSGIWSAWLPDEGWWPYLWATIVVVFCVAICLAGSALFSRASNGLLLILLLATVSIPASAILVAPFRRAGHLRQYTNFTGVSIHTLRNNLLPRFTKGAAGSQVKTHETWSDMFGILFPACGGLYAGASMSGDLKNASKSIPSGTLYGLFLTFVCYALVIIAMAASISRETFYRNVNVVQDINVSEVLVILGEVATTSFSVLMGIIGPAKQLQAIARDGIFPGLRLFGQGTQKADDPIYAILLTWFVAQITILFDINSIASLVTMSYLMMNFALHLACLLLKVSSAPNFRPSFRFFNVWTASLGAVLSVGSMFFVDADAAAASIGILVLLFLIIHYTTPPKAWGSDVTSGLVYHQVRKYLLRLRTESVKYWRPQILLFVNDPRRGFKLIKFANSLKKGGLFILGHVIVSDDFGDSIPEVKRQRAAWTQFIDLIRIKAFINVLSSPSMEWGSRNLVLSAGLGGMRPNIVMMGFFNLEQFRKEQPLVDVPSPPPERTGTLRRRRKSHGQVKGALPTDVCFVEKRTDLQSYVLTLEDLVLKLKINVALATGFSDLELPEEKGSELTKKYIDLWPIQMSASIAADSGEHGTASLTTTNFDTYTLILQLGCILNTVPAWKKAYKLRVAVFVEYESDVAEEKERVTTLLENLRIKASVLVFHLACGRFKTYNFVVNGEQADEEIEKQVDQVLEDEEWWNELQKVRGKVRTGEVSALDALSMADEVVWPPSLADRRDPSMVRYSGLRKILEGPRRRSSIGNLSSMGVVPSMRTHRLDDDLLSRHASYASDHSSYDDSDDTDEYDLDDEDADDEYGQSAEESTMSETRDSDRLQTSRSVHSRPTSRKSSKKSSKKSSRRASAASSLQAAPKDSLENTDMQQYLDEPRKIRGRAQLRPSASIEAMAGGSLMTRLETPVDARRSRAASPAFSAKPIPEAQTSDNEDGLGPSIMFADQTHPRHQEEAPKLKFEADIPDGPTNNANSIYTRGVSRDPPAKAANQESPSRVSIGTNKSGSDYPSRASIPLSFNDLPCRAQHLILNELISQNSEEAAVVFTTLPAPIDGTWKSESDSLSYISDLEVLTQGLGPTLLVHSNSMTVTTNL